MFLKINNIKKKYGEMDILKDVSFSLDRGECLGIIGASGCGKTTLLKGIVGLLDVDDGTVSVADKIVQNGVKSLPPHERGIGLVFQDLALWPHMTALENVAFMFPKGPNRKERRNMASGLLRSVSLHVGHDKCPDELSGGEQQRVAIARALAGWPEVILMDEPFSGLDSALKDELSDLVVRLKEERKISFIYVSHILEDVNSVADKVMVLDDGVLKDAD